MKKTAVTRTAAQKAAGVKFAAAGRAAQARKRGGQRSAAQVAAAQKFAAAGRAAQARKRLHLPPLPKAKRALAVSAGVGVGDGVGAGDGWDEDDGVGWGDSGCGGVGVGGGGGWTLLYQPVLWPACAATAVANHLRVSGGIAATEHQIIALHLAAGGDDEHGVLISDVLEVAAERGLAGTRIERFWPVAGQDLPGLVAGLRLPRGAHTVLTVGGNLCASWGAVRPLAGNVEEAWWIEWRAG